jgi:hypothetical protein
MLLHLVLSRVYPVCGSLETQSQAWAVGRRATDDCIISAKDYYSKVDNMEYIWHKQYWLTLVSASASHFPDLI